MFISKYPIEHFGEGVGPVLECRTQFGSVEQPDGNLQLRICTQTSIFSKDLETIPARTAPAANCPGGELTSFVSVSRAPVAIAISGL
jgi:hypothetical protein